MLDFEGLVEGLHDSRGQRNPDGHFDPGFKGKGLFEDLSAEPPQHISENAAIEKKTEDPAEAFKDGFF